MCRWRGRAPSTVSSVSCAPTMPRMSYSLKMFVIHKVRLIRNCRTKAAILHAKAPQCSSRIAAFLLYFRLCRQGNKLRPIRIENCVRHCRRYANRSLMRTFVSISFSAVCLLSVARCAMLPRASPKRRRRRRPTTTGGQIKTFEVRLPVTVTQKKSSGHGTEQRRFSVFEDGVQQEVTFFYRRKDESAGLCRRFDGHIAIDRRQARAFQKKRRRISSTRSSQLRKDKAAFMTFDQRDQSAAGFHRQARPARQSGRQGKEDRFADGALRCCLAVHG